MEAKMIFICFVLFLDTVAASVITEQNVVGLMGTSVTIPCKITYSDRDVWYVVQWKKTINNSSKTLVTLSNTFTNELTPRWELDQDISEFKTRARTNVYKDESTVTFNLTVYDFSCRDEGMYYCDVVSSQRKVGVTNVTIKAKPLPPKVHTNVLELEENESYPVECEAIVGIPPADLHWYYRRPDELKFILVQPQPEVQIKSGTTDCRPRAKQELVIKASEKSSGTTYRCLVNSSNCGGGNQKCYADVRLEVRAKVAATLKPDQTYEVEQPCVGNACKKGIRDNSSLWNKGSLLGTVLAFLYTVVSTYGLT